MNFDAEFVHKMMRLAVEEGARGSGCADGGPFGAVIVDAEGNLLAAAHNRVLVDHDPTAHAEVTAIREACKRLGTHDLSGCTLFSSCEPCPMCLSAVIWANIKLLYFGGTREDAAKIGFRDQAIYDYLAGDDKLGLQVVALSPDDCRELFAAYQQNQGQMY